MFVGDRFRHQFGDRKYRDTASISPIFPFSLVHPIHFSSYCDYHIVMDEFGVFSMVFVVALSVVAGFIVSYYPFDLTWERDVSSATSMEYDYVIVGGGTAGSVLASRLTEDPNVSVLLLEAGGLHNWMSQVPLMCPFLQGAKLDWQFVTVPQAQSSYGLQDRKSRWPRGLGLGGSSLINYMVHMRGMPEDYDGWRSTGCSQWTYSELLKYFVMSESIQHAPSTMDTSFGDVRGHYGPLLVQQNMEDCLRSTTCNAFLNSMEETGYVVGDLNGNIDYGVMPTESNIFEGKRFSVYNGYVQPAINRSNLDILLHSAVQRIMIDDTPRAVGVLVLRRGKLFSYRCRHEVILSAGAINTPHLLMVSGVGRFEDLNTLQITPTAPFLPVGENLQDHLSLPVFIELGNASNMVYKESLFHMNAIFDFLLNKDGVLTKNGISAVARIPVPHWVYSQSNDTNVRSSDLLLFLLELKTGPLDADLYTRISNLQASIFGEMFPQSQDRDGFVLLVIGTHPRSRGSVRVDKDDWMPVIDPNYLDEDEDVQDFSYGIRFVAALMETAGMKSIGARMHLPELSECDTFEPDINDDGFLECWIRTAAVTAYHPVGTCRMGTDKEAVVDCDLKVNGVKDLRVVDASVMSPVSASPAATVVVMAEKAARLIATDNKQKREAR